MELTAEERETAARTSYAYWLAATAATAQKQPNLDDNRTEGDGSDDQEGKQEEIRARMAMREARRHLVGEFGNYQSALANLRRTCQFRKERRMDLLRTCFSDDKVGGSKTNETAATVDDVAGSSSGSCAIGDDEESVRSRYRDLIRKDLETQPMAIRGHDRGRRAILIKTGRLSRETDDEAYMLAQLYMVERATACTEALSAGVEEEIVAVFDFATYSSAHSPPVRTVIRTMTALQHHYPERLRKLVVLDGPLWMRGLFHAVSPFLSDKTKSKIVLASGPAGKEASLSPLVDPDHATPFMLPDGKLSSPIETRKVLNDVAFHSLYDAD
jgi:hypothetical protein